MAYELRREDLEPLLLGAAFFGSGGGGTIESARHLAAHFIAGDYYPADTVKVVSVDEATEGAAVMVAYLGAPEAINSALYPLGPVTAVQNVQTRLASQSTRLAYVMPPESGALGFTVAALVAAKLGLAVIDADGAGRAVPSLPMLTFAAAEIDPRPAFLVSQGGLCSEPGELVSAEVDTSGGFDVGKPIRTNQLIHGLKLDNWSNSSNFGGTRGRNCPTLPIDLAVVPRPHGYLNLARSLLLSIR
ncbi:MAG: uncharacterized protein QOC89_1218 [Paraburkholderia sp.]|jgi:DUF917 family protein|nr:uncharacterized protein [Paraburkholderia sp.]